MSMRLASRHSFSWTVVELALFLMVSGFFSLPRAALVINEVLYDPAGADGDQEFVELYNTGPEVEDLAGVELIFVNGSDPGLPRTIWVGRAGMTLAVSSWWVVGEDDVSRADVHSSLDMQNGSEAVWLRRANMVLDRVAWGTIEGLGEGRPAEDLSGQSLGRVPDGADSNDNSADFVGLSQPNPGRENAPPEAFAVEELFLDPPWPAEPGETRLEVTFRAVGWQSLQRARVDVPAAAMVEDSFTVARGDTVQRSWMVRLERDTAVVEVAVNGLVFALPVQVGVGELRLNEVMARPVSGEPEWIELFHAGEDTLDLSDWALADASRAMHRLGGNLRLAPRHYLILAARTGDIALRRPAKVWRPEGGWPSLNQSDGDEGFADELLLYDDRGAVVDWVRWKARDFPAPGQSLERAAVTSATPSLWLSAPGGASPGAGNDAARYPAPLAGLQLEPNPFSPDGDGHDDLLHIALHDLQVARAARAEVLDLNGDRVVELVAARSREVVQWIWDGRDSAGRRVPWGAYVVRVRGSDGGRNWRRMVAVGGGHR